MSEKFKYSVNTNSLPKDWSYAEIAKMCSRVGVEGIEWGLPSKDTARVIKEMAGVTKDQGLEVLGYINGGHLWKTALMRSWSEMVASVGGNSLRVAAPWVAYNFEESLHQKDSFMDLVKMTREGLDNLIPLAKEFKIKYVLEMHGGGLSASAPMIRYLMEGLDPECVGAIYDPANGIYEGFTRPRHAVEVLGPYLSYVHAKNALVSYSGDYMKGNVRRAAWETKNCSLEGGLIDFLEVYFALNVVGYRGWIAMEEFYQESPEEQIIRGLGFLRECERNAPSRPQEPYTTFNE